MKKIKKEIIEQIDSALFEIISSYVDLRKAGAYYKALSPFNPEKTPSFIVAPQKGIWKDFSSGKGGKSVIKFIMEYEGLSFKDAVIKGAEILGIDIEYEDSDEEWFFERALESLLYFFRQNIGRAKEYLYMRGLTDESIEKWEIGFAPSFKETKEFFKNSPYLKEFEKMKYCWYKKDTDEIIPKFFDRVMFPIRNHYGELVGFSGRDITGKAKAKYVNSNDFEFFKKSKILFGLDKINKSLKKVILVEGQLDVILAHQYGVNIAVASQGTAFTQSHFNLIKDYDIMISFDGDKAGRKATATTSEIIMKNGVNPKIALLPIGKDVADVLTEKGRKEYFKYLKNYILATDYVVDYILENTPDEKRIEALDSIKQKLGLFPNHISEKILAKIIAISNNYQLKEKAIKSTYIDEMSLVKFILENGLEKEYINPFKDCFRIKNFSYNYVKDSPDLTEDEFYDLWRGFELSCYKRRIKKIKESDLPYQEKKKQIQELQRSIDAAKLI